MNEKKEKNGRLSKFITQEQSTYKRTKREAWAQKISPLMHDKADFGYYLDNL